LILMQFWAAGKGLPAASYLGAAGNEPGQVIELPAQPLSVISSAHAASPVGNSGRYFIVTTP
jgi:hypothetical protein